MPFQGKGWYHISGTKLPEEEFKTKQELEGVAASEAFWRCYWNKQKK